MRKMLFGAAALAGTGLLGAILLERVFRFPRRRPAVPQALTTRAVIPGIPDARYLVSVDVEPFVEDVVAARQREQKVLASSGHHGPLPRADMLAISGGGDKGAF